MKPRSAILLAAGAFVATAARAEIAVPSIAGSPAEEIASLAHNLDNAVKVCSEETARGAKGDHAVGSMEALAVQRGLLRFVEAPPAGLEALAAKHGRARIGRWFDPHATIWFIAWDTAPTCRILVSGSPWTTGVRPELYRLLQIDSFWKLEGAEEVLANGMPHATFYAELGPEAKVRPTVTITAAPPNVPDNEMQLNIGVSMIIKVEK